ncbi:UNVERIFIED_CONTAM: hypothetical protein GTU68_036520 [Idotea baltica]|nr:hypothetical protein [Idotea baltica]
MQLLANRFFAPLPAVMPDSENDSVAKIALGKALYFETALSYNRSQSCNSCHRLTEGGAGVDNLKTSLGALGHRGERNSPTTYNAGLQFAQFWDGRAKNLLEQGKGPIFNQSEMAMSSENQVVNRLVEQRYLNQFEHAFPGQAAPLKMDNILEALAAFQRTLITRDRFDVYLKGDAAALSAPEKQGLMMFISKGCNACHTGALLGGQLFMKMGIVHAYPNIVDKGRGKITGNPADNFIFKVPSLRNVAQTAPYFHDGKAETLEEAIIQTAWHQLGTKLTPQEVEDIRLFLLSLNNLEKFAN